MADLIDRGASIRFISNIEREDEDRLFTFEEIKKMLRDAPAVNRWIPCAERMPENNVPVLYVWRSQNGAVAVLHGWHFEIRSLGSAWHQSGVGFHRPDEEVTHWMPLPEPPEKE